MQRPTMEQVDISSDDSSSDGDVTPLTLNQPKDEPLNLLEGEPLPELSEEEWLLRRAKSYQDSMKVIPIPVDRDNVVPYKTWEGLAWSIKQIYKQPLHYLTNLKLEKMDQERHEAEDEFIQLDILMHPVKAETLIWLMEEGHRRITSPTALMKYWMEDPDYHRHIDDDIHPKPQS